MNATTTPLPAGTVLPAKAAGQAIGRVVVVPVCGMHVGGRLTAVAPAPPSGIRLTLADIDVTQDLNLFRSHPIEVIA